MKPSLLLQAVREVSLLANNVHPETVSQRVFDATAEQHKHEPQFADLPLARDIARKLKYSWPTVLEIAHSPLKTQTRRLGQLTAEAEQDWLTPERIAYALTLVAHRLNLPSVSQAQYETAREKLLAQNRANWLHGGRLKLPTVAQIRAVMRTEIYGTDRRGTPTAGSWSRALELAGLQTKAVSKMKNPARNPIDLLERCYDAHGFQATSQEARDFAKANNIPYSRGPGKPWREWVQEWKTKRKERGLPVPDRPPPRKLKPDYTLNIGAGLPDEHRQGSWADPNECITIIISYLTQTPSSEHATMSRYAAWAKKQPHAPDPATFKRHGGWDQLREQAHQRILKPDSDLDG